MFEGVRFFIKPSKKNKGKMIFLISKKNISLAVKRNLMKRRIRSAVREAFKELSLKQNLNFTFIVSKVVHVKNEHLKKAIFSLLRKQKQL